MKTIEERAKDYSPTHEHFQECYKDACLEQRNIDVDKACEWMYDNFMNKDYYWEGALSSCMFVEAFRKAMEE